MNKFLLFVFLLVWMSSIAFASTIIPANDPHIQYFGRWDMSNAAAPTHSWPGIYIIASFEGTSIGIMTNDNFSYYNITMDDTVQSIFHGTGSGIASYTLASGLADAPHTIRIALRNETNWTSFTFNGFILDDGKNLLPAPVRFAKKIEFIGDSYTVASGNEYTEAGAAPNDSYTNIDKGFGPLVGKHYGTQYQMSGRGGFGLVLDYQGNYANTIPLNFDRTLVYTPLPKWNFSQWVPNLVVICLGLNDYNGWGGYSGPIPAENSVLYKKTYHSFISTIMDVYPGAKILLVAANGIDWLKTNVSQVASEEQAMGHKNIFYTFFPYYNGGYVNNGHPTVATHQLIANQLIATIDTIDAWTPYHDTIAPHFVKYPAASFVATSANFFLNVTTDKYASVRYSSLDKPYDQMEHTFGSTGTRTHSAYLNCSQGQHYTYYLRAKDAYGNSTDSAAIVDFTVDTNKVLLTWSSIGYDVSQWKKGTAPIGNASGETTKVSLVPTVYFRQSFNLSNVSAITDLRVFAVGSNGLVAYINGSEIGRINMDPTAEVSFGTPALKAVAMASKLVLSADALKTLRNGENVLSVEVHSADPANPTVSFDMETYDILNYTYSPMGADWYYDDRGKTPPDQLANKPSNYAADGSIVVPKGINLYANYPNPFNPSTTIRYDIPTTGRVTMKVFDLVGREIATLVDEVKSPGSYVATFNAVNLSSGMYLCRLQAGRSTLVNKLMLVK